MDSRRSARWIVVCVMIACSLGAMMPLALTAFAQAETSGPFVARIDSVGIVVDDMDRSLAFYTGVLPFTLVSERESSGEGWERLRGAAGVRMRTVTLALQEERIELVDYLTPESAPIPADSQSNDLWFQHVAIVVSDMDAAYRHLRSHGVHSVSTQPQTLPSWNPNAGGIEAFYFKDPDGHVLEVISFPPGKGQERWQRRDALFLGIDHTAIVVDDTDASLRFYQGELGMSIAGTSENHGIEQERLNNVPGARLRITALRASGGGPGVELLEYLTPDSGRAIPVDASRTDLASWHVTAASTRLDAAPSEAWKARWTSPGIVSIDGGASAGLRAIAIRDPDGHVIEIVETEEGASR